MAGHLTSHVYGKHQVRVSKVRRPRQAAAKTERHEFVEVSVDVELHGGFDAAYTEGDNTSVIATDTCKNTIYCLAKDHPVDTIESFGLAIGRHFCGRYDHVDACRVLLKERVWDRLGDSPHGFVARDASTPTAEVRVSSGGEESVHSGLENLLIAKTTESGFEDFHRDEFRTLADTDDRIFATSVTAGWRYATADADFAAGRSAIVGALLARFLDHYSRSVQESLYFMGQAALDACGDAAEIKLTLPNKHHLLVDLAPFGRENENEVFVATDEPFGFISATVGRE